MDFLTRLIWFKGKDYRSELQKSALYSPVSSPVSETRNKLFLVFG